MYHTKAPQLLRTDNYIWVPNVMNGEHKVTETARKRYNRIAPIYDLMELFVERSSFGRLRELLWSKVEGSRLLEVGVGTGKNFSFYPIDVDITAIDFSERMLKRAEARAKKSRVDVRLMQMDVQQLEFEDDAFDTVADTFVFCSVPDPIRGLKEVERVCRPGGKVIMLEHVLSANRILAKFMNISNSLVVRTMGANINRRTVENVTEIGLVVEKVTEYGLGIVKLIEARKRE